MVACEPPFVKPGGVLVQGNRVLFSAVSLILGPDLTNGGFPGDNMPAVAWVSVVSVPEFHRCMQWHSEKTVTACHSR